ncbi:hypothetical protein [Veillonella magna]|uniref:hypothetical protein n=1 Tax=Veillonella magna TaxID=464322 RepID=UPI0023F0ECBD|nr:hypothetical protein [Veillonella magna]
MESFELIQYLQNKRRELSHALQESKKRGIALANAEKNYKREKAKFIAKARMDKVAVTLVGDLAKGDMDISELRHERDIAKVLYLNAQEAINVYKLECRLVEAQIKREWEDA